MKKVVRLGTIVIFLLLGCRKTDVAKQDSVNDINSEQTSTSRNCGESNCDYQQALSKAISDEGTQEVPLFQKYYSGSRLQKINLRFRNVAAGVSDPFVLNVVYQPNRMIFLRESNADTTAILDFNRSGKLVSARAPIPFTQGWGLQTPFRFFYHQGRLKKIESGHLEQTGSEEYETVWFPYINIDYDLQKKNVFQITFPAFGSTTGESIKYWYDYSRKAKAQVYPDDMLGDYHYFFYFLKYLNIFPELMPENILIRSIEDTEYPGTFDRQYSDHKFDASGKLISYRQNTLQGPGALDEEIWKIDWKCFRNNNQHSWQQ